MKKSLIKTRAHFVLFAKDSPFKKKVINSKKAYTRKLKHKVANATQ